MKNKLTIIVQAFNPTKEALTKTIKSLNAQIDKEFDVLFFDNCSKDNWHQGLPEISINFNYKIDKSSFNKGAAAGRNLAIASIKSDGIAKIDDGDSVPNNYTLEINKCIRDGHDAIFLSTDKNKKEIKGYFPFLYVLKKDLFIEYPEQPAYYVEDRMSSVYYMFKANNPKIIFMEFYHEVNSRGIDCEKNIKSLESAADFYYGFHKIEDNDLAKISFNIRGYIKYKKGQPFSSKKNKMLSNIFITELREVYDKVERVNLKRLKVVYKKFSYFSLNPMHKLGPSMIYRFFKK